MFAGSSVMPSDVVTSAALGSTSPATLRGSTPEACPDLCRARTSNTLGVQVNEQNTLSSSTNAAPTTRRWSFSPPRLLIGNGQYLGHADHPDMPRPYPAESVGVSVVNHRLVLLRHGQTEWSRDGKHTSSTDLDLTERGREQAKLAALPAAASGPGSARDLQSAQTRSGDRGLAGLTIDQVSPLLVEWDYGDYGASPPRDPHDSARLVGVDLRLPGGRASTRSACARTKPCCTRWTTCPTETWSSSAGHFSRAVATRWVEQPLREGARYGFGSLRGGMRLRTRTTAAVCAGYDRGDVVRPERALRDRGNGTTAAFPDVTQACLALRDGSADLVVGALPFDVQNTPSALFAPESATFTHAAAVCARHVDEGANR